MTSLPSLQTLKGDILGGGVSAIVALPTSIVCGLLAFSPLGQDYVGMGVLAGLVGSVLISITATVFGASPIQISGPRSALAMIMAAVLIHIDDALLMPDGGLNRELVLISLMYLCLLLAGCFQVLFGVLGLGKLIKFIPLPVIAGLINGFALLIILQQLPVLFGESHFSNMAAIWDMPSHANGVALSVAFTSVFVFVLSKRFISPLSGSLLGLLAGTALHYVLIPEGGGNGLVGEIPAVDWPFPEHLTTLVSGGLAQVNIWPLMVSLLSSSLALAFLSSAQSLLCLSIMESQSRQRYDGNRELLGQGLANITSALFGGLAGGGAAIRSVTTFKTGGRTRWSGIVHGLVFLMIVLGFSGMIGQVPLAAIAGVLIVVAVQMIDKETLRQAHALLLRPAEARETYAVPNVVITFLVTVLTVTVDFVTAAGIGVITAALMFSAQMGKVVVRSLHRGGNFRSKTSRPREAIDILEKSDDAIMVFEAQGPVFFGSADQLAQEIESASQSAEIVILDLRRVTAIDETGLRILLRLGNAMREKGKAFFVSHLHDETPIWHAVDDLEGNGRDLKQCSFVDTDSALSKAEDLVLAKHLEGVRWDLSIPLSKIDILQNLNDEQRDYLAATMEKRTYLEGQTILEQGEDTTDMYLLSSGSVSVMMNVPESRRQVRLASLRPGVAFGEMGLINDAPRSTSVVAEQNVTCFVLSRADFMRLVDQRPDISTTLSLNMLREMSSRLRVTSVQVSELER